MSLTDLSQLFCTPFLGMECTKNELYKLYSWFFCASSQPIGETSALSSGCIKPKLNICVELAAQGWPCASGHPLGAALGQSVAKGSLGVTFLWPPQPEEVSCLTWWWFHTIDVKDTRYFPQTPSKGNHLRTWPVWGDLLTKHRAIIATTDRAWGRKCQSWDAEFASYINKCRV